MSNHATNSGPATANGADLVVAGVSDGEALYKRLATVAPDLLLLESRIPGVETQTLCERLRLDPPAAESGAVPQHQISCDVVPRMTSEPNIRLYGCVLAFSLGSGAQVFFGTKRQSHQCRRRRWTHCVFSGASYMRMSIEL